MNNIIKEIENWKIGIETGKDKYGIKVDGIGYTWKELKLLLDYITNLQQELEDYKSRIEKTVEYGNSCINKDLDLETLDEPYKTTFKTAYEIHNNYLNILNGRSDE